MLFEMGQVAFTLRCSEALEAAHSDGREYMVRHLTGDWGEVSAEDVAMNDRRVAEGRYLLLSAYTLPTGVKIWIVTQPDRSATTFLLPSEF
jgi:hypothetical protein